MLVQQFESAVAGAQVQLKGVKVSLELWKALKAAGLIEMRAVAAWGALDLGFEMRFYQDIILLYDPELSLSDTNYQLPPNAS
ncbi:MAG: hypothetical protein HGB26_05015 [Desulfobulbaceae bacterium]|nr:hypothetical protein [Desulfobulbaceae bacterium]